MVSCKKLFTLLDLCVSSLRRGHANLLCIVPILTDDPRRESKSVSAEARTDTSIANERVRAVFAPAVSMASFILTFAHAVGRKAGKVKL